MWDIEQEEQPVGYGYAIVASQDAQDWLRSLQQVEGAQSVRNSERHWTLDTRIAGRYFGVLAFRDRDPVLIAALTPSAWETQEKTGVAPGRVAPGRVAPGRVAPGRVAPGTGLDAATAGHPLSWFPLIPWRASLEQDLVTEPVPDDLSEKRTKALRHKLTYRQPVLRLTCPALSHDGKKFPEWSLTLVIAPSVYRRLKQAREASLAVGASRFMLGRAGFVPILGWAVDWGAPETPVSLHDGAPSLQEASLPGASLPGASLRMGWD